MRIKTLLGFGVTTVASALTLQCGPVWADGPETAYADDDVPAGSLSPNESQVNADGMKEDPNAKMSEVARAYRNGYINRGKEDQAGYEAMIDSHNHGQRQPVKTDTDVARVDVPPLPAGVPEDDSSKYTSIPPQPRQYAQRQVPQPPQQPQQPPQPQPQYRQAYQPQQYAQAPMQYQPAPQYAQPQPVYADSQPVYVRQDYAPPPVQYVPVYGQPQYAQPQYEEMPVVDVMQPVAPPVAYQVYRPPVYVATPRMYAYRAQPVVSYGMWR